MSIQISTSQDQAVRSRPRPLDASPQRGLVISLDFELLWGVRDLATAESYRKSVLGVRQAIPAILQLFAEFDIHATWATVGILLFDNKRDLLASLPNVQPTYLNPHLSPYHDLEDIGSDEDTDPYHYGLSLAHSILQTPGQEIGSHTYCHYYCLEPGQTVDQFHADCAAAVCAIERITAPPKSLVFPRNQFQVDYAAACLDHGISVFRGNEQHWAYKASDAAGNSAWKRGARLVDSYLGLSGHNGIRPQPHGGLTNVPASRFLRPFNTNLRRFEALRAQRIVSAMRTAFEQDRAFHLWWHPHNFGTQLAENLNMLREVLRQFATLREQIDCPSFTMTEYAALASRA